MKLLQSIEAHALGLGAFVTQAPAQGNVGAGSGDLSAGAHHEGGQGKGQGLCDTRRSLLAGVPPLPILAGTNTTIGVIATDAKLSKTQAQRLAQIVFAHILARKSGDTQ